MLWKVDDLFPECTLPTCQFYGKSHRLPHQSELLTAEENFIYWQGGVGSSKTVAHAVLATVHALSIPNNRIILFRRDLELNYKTLWMRFKECIKRACEKKIIKANYDKLWSVKKAGDYTKCELPNGTIIFCGQTKSWSDYMGPEYGFIGVDDAMENPHEFFRGEGTVGGMQSRLRLAEATYFKLPNGSVKDMRRFVLTSNPPPYDHWLWSIFGKTAGVRKFAGSDISYRFILTSTNQNDHLPSSYIEELSSQHDEEDLARILQGKSVAYYGGVKVYKRFREEKHVGEFEANESLPLLISIDPGIQHPAAVICQAPRCSFDLEHFIALSELSHLYDVSTSRFIGDWEDTELPDDGLLSHIYAHYPTHFDYPTFKKVKSLLDNKNPSLSVYGRNQLTEFFSKILFCCDRAADKSEQARRDKRSVRKIWRDEYGIQTRRKFLGLEKSLNRMIRLLDEKCLCGQYRLLFNNECEMLIEAYKGGYRYAKKRDGSHSDKPLEDHKFEDVSDAHRYAVENFYNVYYESVEAEEIQPLREDYLVLNGVETWEDFFK